GRSSGRRVRRHGASDGSCPSRYPRSCPRASRRVLSLMNVVERLLRKADSSQRRLPWLAFPLAVLKKYGDDGAGNLAALMAYYAFLSIFPILLVFATVLGFVLRGNPDLYQRLLNSALVEFPVVGDSLRFEGLH